MRSVGIWQSHPGVGFQAGMRFHWTALSSPPRSDTPSLLETSSSSPSSAPIRRSRRCHPSCRSYSSLFATFDGASSNGGGDEEKADGLPEGTPSSSGSDDGAPATDGIGDGAAVMPEPRADEQIADSLADAAAAGKADPSAAEEQIDWDKAWATTRQRMEKEKKEAPAFSGRKQVVASKNAEGGYDFEEISADGSRRMKGDRGSGGFGFSSQMEDGPGRVRRQEQEAVNLATTNKAFAGLFAILLASLIFEVNVYMSGGITNGSTRFQDIGQPTTYDELPLPPTPPPEDDLTV
eukprot:g1252.t1